MPANPCMHRLILEERPDRPDDDSSVIMLNRDMMQKLGVSQYGHLLLKGAGFRQTVGIVQESQGLDKLKVRVSASTRGNLRVRAGDRVTVCSFYGLPIGEHVRVAPMDSPSLDGSEDLLACYLVPHFRGANRPVSRGDTFVVRAGPRPVVFQVMTVSPGESVVVSTDTSIECDDVPVRPEFENKHAPASPRVPFSPMVVVSVWDLDGEELLERLDLLRTTTVTQVKEHMQQKALTRLVRGDNPTRSRTFLAMSCGVKLIHQRRALENFETFESEAYEAVVELSAVLFVRMYSAISWGDNEAGGNSDKVREQLSGRITNVFCGGRAFAALNTAGHLTTWGDASCGGDSSSVERYISSHVLKVFANSSAFVALKKGGGTVAWGDPEAGGDAYRVKEQLREGIANIVGNDGAFAALKDASRGRLEGHGYEVLTWGMPSSGGDSSAVYGQLSSGVLEVVCTDNAFAARKLDGAVVAWGDPKTGGHIGEVSSQLTKCTKLCSNRSAFAALRQDGMVYTWGDPMYCGTGYSGRVVRKLHNNVAAWNAVAIYANRYAFAAVKSNGGVTSWGNQHFGGDSSLVAAELSEGVDKLYWNDCAFAALKTSGAIVTWGAELHGGDSSSVSEELASEVSFVESNPWAFAAVKVNGAVVTWGEPESGGNSSHVAKQLADSVTHVYHTERAFAALKTAGAVVCWGEGMFGGDSQGVAEQLSSGVTEICPSQGAFAALKENGAVVAWGDRNRGGDCLSNLGPKHHGDMIEKLSSSVSHLYSNGLAFVALRDGGIYQC